jgi:transposase-like protein
MKTPTLPKTQIEAIRFFGDDEVCHTFLAEMRWGGSVRCAHCESDKVGGLVVTVVASRSKKADAKPTTRRLWNCKACKKQFTVKTGTIFEDSALPLSKWLPAVWMICNAKNGVSSCELARSLGVTQKSAWFMGHRIRVAMREGNFNLSGTVEVDETYYGPRAQRMNKAARDRRVIRRGGEGKIAVQGILERSDIKGHSKVALEVLDATNTPTMQKAVRNRVEKGASVYTDAHSAYVTLRDAYSHDFVDHAIAYANGAVHTNGLENFWSLLKRTLRGTYVHVSPMHLFRYLDEQAVRFNERSGDDQTRFLSTMNRVKGRRLPYAALTGIGII